MSLPASATDLVLPTPTPTPTPTEAAPLEAGDTVVLQAVPARGAADAHGNAVSNGEAPAPTPEPSPELPEAISAADGVKDAVNEKSEAVGSIVRDTGRFRASASAIRGFRCGTG